MATEEGIERAGRDWLAARGVIVKACKEWNPGKTQANYEHFAAAILARMAHLDPPLLLCRPDDMKE